MQRDIADRAKAIIDEGGNRDSTSEALARALAVTVRTLNREFQKHHGLSAAAYMRQRRLTEACDLLTTSLASVKQAATQAGISRAQLSRLALRALKMPLSTYRARHFNRDEAEATVVKAPSGRDR